MAIEKILNTRIGLKVDTLENWGKSTLPLKKGEVAFATVAATAGNGLTEPVVMMKIGEDGVKTFKDIEWNFYAKASDVLASAKSEDALREFINGVIANAGIATDEAMGKLAERVATLEGDENTAGSVAKAIKDAIDALDLSNTYAAKEHSHTKAEITDFAHTHTKSEITDFAHNHEISEVNGLQDALDNKQAKGDYAAEIHTHVKADITDFAHNHTASEVTDFAVEVAKVKVENAAKADEATKATQDGNGKVIADTYAEKATTLAGYNIGNAYTKGEVDGLIQGAKDYADNNDANTEYHVEYDSVNKKIKLVAGADASKMEIPTDDFIKDGMIQTVEIKDNNLVITWNTDAGKSATNIPLSELVDVMTGVDGTTITVNVSADDKISAEVKTGSLKDGHIASDAAIAKGKLASDVQTSLGLADSAVQEDDIKDLRSASHTHTFDEDELNKIVDGDVEKWNNAEQNAKDYTDDEIEKLALGTMSKETAVDYVKKSEAVGYGDILTKTEAISAYQPKGEYYTKTEADAAFTDSTEVDNQIDAKIVALELDKKYQAKGEYATAEQGGKADSALQEITTTENGGLKVTNKNQIDIDENIVFVFDCGDSGVTA